MDSSTFFAISFVALALFCSATVVESKPVPAIFVFGDSLADVGNNNYLDVAMRYRSNFPFNGIDFPGRVPTGRFSNGFNGIDFIAMNLSFEKSPPPYLSIKNADKMKRGQLRFCWLRNTPNYCNLRSYHCSLIFLVAIIYQIQGNGTLNLTTQVNYFAKTKEALVKQFGESVVDDFLPKSLSYFSTANNDIIAFYNATGAANSTQNTQFISNVVTEFMGHVTTIYKLGARKFVITGTGSIGCLPVLRKLNSTGGCIDVLNQLSIQFNAVALPQIQQLGNRLAGFKYYYMNYNYSYMTAKAAYGFKEIESACCGAGKFNGAEQCTKNATLCSDRTRYFFWDLFHPTQAAYNLTAHF